MLYLELEMKYEGVNSAGKAVTFLLTCSCCSQRRNVPGDEYHHPGLLRESAQRFPPGTSHCQAGMRVQDLLAWQWLSAGVWLLCGALL